MKNTYALTKPMDGERSTTTSGMISGKVLALGDDLDTDVMYPGRYLSLTNWSDQAQHLFEGLGPEWPGRLHGVRILVAGRNLGIGSSREQAATALLGAGIGLVVAASCSRNFFRNCINNGLPIIQDVGFAAQVRDETNMMVDVAHGIARTSAGEMRFEALPEALLRIVAAGGLLGSLVPPEVDRCD